MTGSLGRARGALRSRDFRFLLSGRLVSQFGDGVFQAFLIDRLVFLAPDNQGTAVGIAKALALLVIPYSILGPFSGVFIDRWSRRKILTLTPLIRTVATLLLLPVAASGPRLYALALVVVSLNRFYLSTAAAVMPTLVPDEDLLVGNSMSGSAGTVATFLGLVVATQVASSLGDATLLWTTAVCWVIATGLAAGIRQTLKAKLPSASLRREVRRVLADLSAGARRLVGTPAAFGSIVTISVDQLLFGVITVVFTVVFKHQFREGVASYGRIIGAGGVGVIVGTVTVGWFEPRLEKPRIVALAFALAGVACLAVAPAVTAPMVLLASFVLGLVYPWKKMPVDTIVQEAVPDRFRGRVFALYDLGFSMARVVAAAIAIPLVTRLSTGWLLASIGVAYLVWAPLPPWWARRRRYVRVRFHAGARADEVPRAIVLAGDEEPVDVLRSWLEDRGEHRVRRFRVRSGDSVIELAAREDGGRWWIESERPATAAATPPPPGDGAET